MILMVLPFRLASARIPKKVLHEIAGIPLCVRTARRVMEGFGRDKNVRVLAAVDSPQVEELLRNALPTLEIVQTSPELPSGTDRVFAAVQILLAREPELRSSLVGIVNIQGDMPFIGQDGLRQVVSFLQQKPRAEEFWVTLSQAWPQSQNIDERGAVKVVTDREGRALYFSRFPIPYSRNNLEDNADSISDLHLGVYGFGLEALTRFCTHAPVALEKAEGLEQLRALWLGLPIYVLQTEVEAGASYRGIDTAADLDWAQSWAQ
jgi:3-deoxy-manno-octulosonate cytidylyltransferase (CMP-KDO synthetase)